MTARERYDELVDDLCARNDDVEPSQMMGMPCVKRSGKMVAGFAQGEGAMVFKLPDPATHARALALDGAHLFDPSGKGQPFKEWVVVPEAHAADWEAFAHDALRPAG
jgi:hypothetical protein